MIIPRKDPERTRFVVDVLNNCTQSTQDRVTLYDKRRRYYLFGTTEGQVVLYNRLYAHTDLIASFIYAADHCRFSVSSEENADAAVIAQLKAVEENWNDTFRDSGIAYDFGQALVWSIVYDSMFLKMNWNSQRNQLMARMVPPHHIGVWDETETDLDAQEAFVHTYVLHWDNAVQRLTRAGLRDKIGLIQASVVEQPSLYPNELAAIVALGPQRQGLGDNLQGQVTRAYTPQATYQAQTDTPKVQFAEVWIWDDEANPDEEGVPQGDYCMFTVCEPDVLLSDSRDTIDAIKAVDLKNYASLVRRFPEFRNALRGSKRITPEYGSTSNLYLPGEHPFVHVRPYELIDYFWGEAHTERLIPLQDWSEETLNSIHEILEEQRDPPKYASGGMGLTDEQMMALHGPGSYVYDAMPGFKVERLAREMPPDLFGDFKEIGHVFLEASGLTETVVGKGEQGVRGGGHAKRLAMTGSSRIRKVAVGMEPCLVQIADKGIKLKKRYDDKRLRTKLDSGQTMEFVLDQVEADWQVRVAGHSHSPLFSDEAQDKAVLMLKARAIDREAFIRLIRPPGETGLIHGLRKMEQQEAAAAKAKMQQQILHQAQKA